MDKAPPFRKTYKVQKLHQGVSDEVMDCVVKPT
jgi:hypothetical protein